MKVYYVYLLASKRNGTLYIGVTSDLIRRVWQHKNKALAGFTKRYDLNKLVYYESFANVNLAIRREKRLKEWQRNWKLNLIESINPEWKDLYFEIL